MGVPDVSLVDLTGSKQKVIQRNSCFFLTDFTNQAAQLDLDNCSSSSEEYDSDENLSSSSSDQDDPEEDLKTPVRQKRRHSTWFLFSNYILSVWQALEAKMLSSMSYRPPEVFAFNLKSKLENLRSSSDSEAQNSKSIL